MCNLVHLGDLAHLRHLSHLTHLSHLRYRVHLRYLGHLLVVLHLLGEWRNGLHLERVDGLCGWGWGLDWLHLVNVRGMHGLHLEGMHRMKLLHGLHLGGSEAVLMKLLLLHCLLVNLLL